MGIENKELKIIKGVNVSKGIAISKVFLYQSFVPSISDNLLETKDIPLALNLLSYAQTRATQELDAIIEQLTLQKDEKADIFVAHKMLLLDEDMTSEIKEQINSRVNANKAVQIVFQNYIDMLSGNDNEMLRERVYDLQDVRNRLLRCLENKEEINLKSIKEPVIVVCHDLNTSDTATLNRSMIKGITTEIGGQTSHSAIIARAYEIPAILGVKDICTKVHNDQEIIMDANDNAIILEPTKEQVNEYLEKQKVFNDERQKEKEYLGATACTKDNDRVLVKMNIASCNETELSYCKYADGCGLFRTEFLFMGKNTLPTEEEQFEIYKKVAQSFNGPVTIRTLDIGGDKKLNSFKLPVEDNPFLGERGLRLCFSHLDIFKTQLRAILRASAFGHIKVMFPMVGTMDDVRKVKSIFEEVKVELTKNKQKYGDDVEFGIMIEIPSIAMISDIVAKEVDFASIGTNDLCQYTLAVDRLNSNISSYYQTFNPSVLRLIKYAIQEFNKAGKEISVCGELGGNPLSAAILVGFGIHSLSMSLSNIARVKRMIVNSTYEDLHKLSEDVLCLSTSEEIEQYLKKIIK